MVPGAKSAVREVFEDTYADTYASLVFFWIYSSFQEKKSRVTPKVIKF